MLAMTDVSKQILLGNPDFFPIKPADYGKFMVLSLGTGSAKVEHKYDAASSGKWGILGWLYKNGGSPLIDSFSEASADLVDIQASVLFQALRCEKRYLRIQDDELKGDTSSVDVSIPIGSSSSSLQSTTPYPSASTKRESIVHTLSSTQ